MTVIVTMFLSFLPQFISRALHELWTTATASAILWLYFFFYFFSRSVQTSALDTFNVNRWYENCGDCIVVSVDLQMMPHKWRDYFISREPPLRSGKKINSRLPIIVTNNAMSYFRDKILWIKSVKRYATLEEKQHQHILVITCQHSSWHSRHWYTFLKI